MKTNGIAYLCWCLCFIGICGVQRLYTGRIISGILWLLTFGLLGIGQLVDLFLIPGMVESSDQGMKRSNNLVVQ